MTSSTNLIYAQCKSNKMNEWIRDGISFETFPFTFKNALVLIFQATESKSYVASKGDMSFTVIRYKEGKFHTNTSQRTYLASYYTPDTVASEVMEKYGLEEGKYLDDECSECLFAFIQNN